MKQQNILTNYIIIGGKSMFKLKQKKEVLTEERIQEQMLYGKCEFLDGLISSLDGNKTVLEELKEFTNVLDEKRYRKKWNDMVDSWQFTLKKRIHEITLDLEEKCRIQNGYYQVLHDFSKQYCVPQVFVKNISYDPELDIILEEEAKEMMAIANELECLKQAPYHIVIEEKEDYDLYIKNLLEILNKLEKCRREINHYTNNKAYFEKLVEHMDQLQNLCNMLQYEITMGNVEDSPTILALNTLIGVVSNQEWKLFHTLNEIEEVVKKEGNAGIVKKIVSFFEEAIPLEDKKNIELHKPYIDISLLLREIKEKVEKSYTFRIQLLKDKHIRLERERKNTLYLCFSKERAQNKAENRLNKNIDRLCLENNIYHELGEMAEFIDKENRYVQIKERLLCIGAKAFKTCIKECERSYKEMATQVNCSLSTLQDEIGKEMQKAEKLKEISRVIMSFSKDMKWASSVQLQNPISWGKLDEGILNAFDDIDQRMSKYIDKE